jgi:hypothetical protein
MGLDAVVFKGMHSLPPEMRNRLRFVDPATGEIEFFEPANKEERLGLSLFAAKEPDWQYRNDSAAGG